jgi:hypothetical protein
MNLLTVQDFFLGIVYLGIIYAIAYGLKSQQQRKGLDSKYFIGGLTAKLTGVTAFCLVYGLYYGGGDTVDYYRSTVAIINLMTDDFDSFYSILIENELTPKNWIAFNKETGYPPYHIWRDASSFAVSRYSVLFGLLGFKSFFVTSLLTAAFCYIGMWKLYRLFTSTYPNTKKALAICILFMPSLVFWGSGIMKDSYVLGATCWFSYNFYHVFIIRKKILLNALLLIINISIIMTMKPYVILSILPGALLWLNNAYLKQVASSFIKMLIIPLLGIVILSSGFFLYRNMGSLMGDYGNLDQAVEKAKIIQQDLLREEQYGGNNYNLGEIDGTAAGMSSIAPLAIFTALYRPLFFEIGSPLMVIAALENTILLLLTILLFLKTSPIKMIRIILSEPLILYSIFFSLLLAFGVGMASTNFGALSRYKIPFMPYYFSAIYLIYSLNTKKKANQHS